MSRVSQYTEEERKERRRIAQARYRLKQGTKVGCPPGRPPRGKIRTLADWAPQVVKEISVLPKPKRKINANSTIEEIREWITEVCLNLSNCDNPAAWASAASIMQRNLELLIKLTPPPKPEPEERERVQIEIEEKDVE